MAGYFISQRQPETAADIITDEHMEKIPEVDIGTCTLCEGCLETCPEVFRMNDSGFIEVKQMSRYPVDCVEEAMKYCPENCITWGEQS